MSGSERLRAVKTPETITPELAVKYHANYG